MSESIESNESVSEREFQYDEIVQVVSYDEIQKFNESIPSTPEEKDAFAKLLADASVKVKQESVTTLVIEMNDGSRFFLSKKLVIKKGSN